MMNCGRSYKSGMPKAIACLVHPDVTIKESLQVQNPARTCVWRFVTPKRIPGWLVVSHMSFKETPGESDPI